MPNITTLSYKINLDNLVTDISYTVFQIVAYSSRFSKGPLTVTAGRHDEGENEVPHIHVAIQVNEWIQSSNEPRRRAKWWAEDSEPLTGLNLKIAKVDVSENDKISNHLAYCWKESKPIDIPLSLYRKPYNVIKLDYPEIARLKAIGTGLYHVSSQGVKRRARLTAKATTLLGQVLILAKAYTNTNTNLEYIHFKQHIYLEFFKNLDIKEYPNIRDFAGVVQKVAIFSKIVPPYYFDKSI